MTPAEILSQIDMVRLRMHIEFEEDCDLPPGFALQLRRELLQAGRKVLDRDRYCRLFEPVAANDSMTVQRFQRPAPAFVLKADSMQGKNVFIGQEWQMEILFIGSGIPLIPDFIRAFQQMGQSGIFRDLGRFNVVAVSSIGASGEVAEISISGRGSAAQVLPLNWLVDRMGNFGNLRLEVVTPARLVSHGKPLFHPDFLHLFPFILRRVGAMLWHWGGVEHEIDPHPLLSAATQVEVLENYLNWEDWKAIPEVRGMEALGGIAGSLLLTGSALMDLHWVLSLGSLLNIGKGAAYGAGEYVLTSTGNGGGWLADTSDAAGDLHCGDLGGGWSSEKKTQWAHMSRGRSSSAIWGASRPGHC
ncbi:MAG: CRISPR system precrRNA processing endoribonuclease RAMP protein Cas6, partial [Methanothrix sp.]